VRVGSVCVGSVRVGSVRGGSRTELPLRATSAILPETARQDCLGSRSGQPGSARSAPCGAARRALARAQATAGPARRS